MRYLAETKCCKKLISAKHADSLVHPPSPTYALVFPTPAADLQSWDHSL